MENYTDEIKLLLIGTEPCKDAQAVLNNIRNTKEIDEDFAIESRMQRFLSNNKDLGSWTSSDGVKQTYTPPTEEELKARLIEKQWVEPEATQPWQIEGFSNKEDWDAKEYGRNRKLEYPSIEDQLDEIYHNGIDSWKETIKTIKDKYPKE